jgi:hypothetical protein
MDGRKVLLRDLERLFRNLYDRNDFYRTELFHSLEKWSEDNLSELSKSLFDRRKGRQSMMTAERC